VIFNACIPVYSLFLHPVHYPTLVLWPSSVLLSYFICRYPDWVVNKSVLELGAGCGLSGLVAARLQELAEEVDNTESDFRPPSRSEWSNCTILTDFNYQVRTQLEHNVLLNRLGRKDDDRVGKHRCKVFGLDFCEQPKPGTVTDSILWPDISFDSLEHGWIDSEGQEHPPVQTILGADIICQPNDAYMAACTIYNALEVGGRAFILCATSDHRYGVEHFRPALRSLGLFCFRRMVSIETMDDGSLQAQLEQTSGYVKDMRFSLFEIEKKGTA
jgi:Lysine methyltransferase